MLKLAANWFRVLEQEFQKPYIQKLKDFLNEEKQKGYRIYPQEKDVFNAFLYTPFSHVEVIILGQDPYHGEGQAHGLSFSVRKGIAQPPSLKNIFKELQNDLHIPPPKHGSLVHWAKQGVLLLNATLTVRASQPKSHYGKGWETFTDAVIEKLCMRKDPLVFMLWGKSAQEKCIRILDHIHHPHLVLKAAHPSPYSAEHFFGCRHFSKANDFLSAKGKSPIDWKIP